MFREPGAERCEEGALEILLEFKFGIPWAVGCEGDWRGMGAALLGEGDKERPTFFEAPLEPLRIPDEMPDAQ